MKVALHQMRSGIDVDANVHCMAKAIADAAGNGASFYFAPEMSVLLDRNRTRARDHITSEHESPAIASLQAAARNAGIWAHIGSMPVISEREPARFANRSLVIDANGTIVARYDKMHLFDVDLATGESWRESGAYIGGEAPVLVDTPLGQLGLSICYDLRFPDLYSHLAKAGARAFAVPAAFTVPTGTAHWHVMLRARAIESAAFVIAAAQTGRHEDGRETYGHSLVVGPWGDILLDMGDSEGLGFAEIVPGRIDEVRQQIPVHLNRRTISPPG